jgi:hypothetical protein
MSPDLIDFSIGKSVGFLSKQLAAARNHRRLVKDVVFVIHDGSTSLNTSKCLLGVARPVRRHVADALVIRARMWASADIDQRSLVTPTWWHGASANCLLL